MGKPIPEISPPKAPVRAAKDQKEDEKKTANNKPPGKRQPVKKTAAPKITFVSGTKLASTMNKSEGTTTATSTAATTTGASASSQDNDVSMEEEGNKSGPWFIEELLPRILSVLIYT